MRGYFWYPVFCGNTEGLLDKIFWCCETWTFDGKLRQHPLSYAWTFSTPELFWSSERCHLQVPLVPWDKKTKIFDKTFDTPSYAKKIETRKLLSHRRFLYVVSWYSERKSLPPSAQKGFMKNFWNRGSPQEIFWCFARQKLRKQLHITLLMKKLSDTWNFFQTPKVRWDKKVFNSKSFEKTGSDKLNKSVVQLMFVGNFLEIAIKTVVSVFNCLQKLIEIVVVEQKKDVASLP